MHFTRESKAISSKVEILVRKQVGKMKKTFDVETLAKENFSENSKENPSSAEKDEEKEVKERAEEDFIIKVESHGKEKSVIVIDWYDRVKIEKAEKII